MTSTPDSQNLVTPEYAYSGFRFRHTLDSSVIRGAFTPSHNFLGQYVTRSHTPLHIVKQTANRRHPSLVKEVRGMKRIKPVVGVATLAVVILGEQWLRNKMRQLALPLP